MRGSDLVSCQPARFNWWAFRHFALWMFTNISKRRRAGLVFFRHRFTRIYADFRMYGDSLCFYTDDKKIHEDQSDPCYPCSNTKNEMEHGFNGWHWFTRIWGCERGFGFLFEWLGDVFQNPVIPMRMEPKFQPQRTQRAQSCNAREWFNRMPAGMFQYPVIQIRMEPKFNRERHRDVKQYTSPPLSQIVTVTAPHCSCGISFFNVFMWA